MSSEQINFGSPESRITEEEAVEALNAQNLEKFRQYAEQCEKEADAQAAADPENPEASNRANIECQIKIAEAYAKSEFKALGLESLEEAHWAASQNPATQDLADRIRAIIYKYQ